MARTARNGRLVVSDLTGDVLAAVVAATVEQKQAALRVLRGEPESTVQKTEVRMPETFVTLKDCAQRLGVSACSLWRWGVPGYELGGRRKFRMTEVEAYLHSEAFRKRAAELRGGKLEGTGAPRGRRPIFGRSGE
jgi:predicted DNA-binding transcriptional regulator AlpA